MFTMKGTTRYIDGIIIPLLPDRSGAKDTNQKQLQDPMSLYGISYKLSHRQQTKVQILTTLSPKDQYLSLVYFKNLPKTRMSEKCRNNKKHNNNNNNNNNNYNSDNPLTSRRTDGGKNQLTYMLECANCHIINFQICSSFNCQLWTSICMVELFYPWAPLSRLSYPKSRF